MRARDGLLNALPPCHKKGISTVISCGCEGRHLSARVSPRGARPGFVLSTARPDFRHAGKNPHRCLDGGWGGECGWEVSIICAVLVVYGNRPLPGLVLGDMAAKGVVGLLVLYLHLAVDHQLGRSRPEIQKNSEG
jgi:hypothetical protein